MKKYPDKTTFDEQSTVIQRPNSSNYKVTLHNEY